MRTASKSTSLAAISLLVLAGCSASPAVEGSASSSPSASTQTQTPEPEPVYVAAPLTGIEYLEGSNPMLGLPAVSAKIDNTSNGRPQLALNQADVVYVTRVEAGMTRLLAVWQSRVPESIGPVRSVRPVDASIVDPYDGVFVYSGGQAPFKSAAKATGLVMSDEDTENGNDTYYREPTRVAPWNLFFRAAKLQELHVEQPAAKPSFEFSAVPSAVALGTPITSLEVKYPELRSTWDLGEAVFDWSEAAEFAWLRTTNGTEHVQADGERVIAKNVVVMEVTHDLSFVDPKYGAIPKAEITNNSGVAHIFSEGYYLKATWTKGAIDEPILLKLESGESVMLAPGNTWIEMMDLPKSKISISYPEAE